MAQRTDKICPMTNNSDYNIIFTYQIFSLRSLLNELWVMPR